jgi:hypothetical protein
MINVVAGDDCSTGAGITGSNQQETAYLLQLATCNKRLLLENIPAARKGEELF